MAADEFELPEPWTPPPVRTTSGALVVSAPVVAESFARGDRVYVRGDVLDRKDPAIKAVPRCVVQWSPPPVDQSSAPNLRST